MNEPAGRGHARRFTLSETVELIHRYGGLAVAAHGLEVSAPSFDEIAKALGMVDGRRCAIA